MSRIHNFNAGPGVLPESVLQEAQDSLWNHAGTGLGILECSHRSTMFDAVVASAKERLARLLKLGDDQHILFMHGGARTQFFMFPMNVLGGGRAAYHDTGTWAHGALEQAGRYGDVDVLFSSRSSKYDRVPQPGEAVDFKPGTKYLHYTSNNTVAGTEYHYVPDVDVPLACDMSSDILSRPIDGSAFSYIYAGAQKNMGPAGVTFVVINDAMLAACDTSIPEMLQYPVHQKNDSMYNTPCTFGIFVMERVAAWLEAQGGVEAIDRVNQAQSDALYGAIDATGFWRGLVQKNSRSRMNVTFTSGDDALDLQFAKEAGKAGLAGLKGHRSVGGLRASIYNAQTDEAVSALVGFMKDFEAKNG